MEQLTEQELDDILRGLKTFPQIQELKAARPPEESDEPHKSWGTYPPSRSEPERRLKKMKLRTERVEYSPGTRKVSPATRCKSRDSRSGHRHDKVRRKEQPESHLHTVGRDRPSRGPERQQHRSESCESSSSYERETYTLTDLAKMTQDTKLTMRRRNEKNHVRLQRELYKKIIRGEFVSTDTVIHALSHPDWSLEDLEKLPRLEPKLSHVMIHVAVLGDIYSCRFPNLSADMHSYAFELSKLSLSYCDATVTCYHNRFFRKVMQCVATGNNLPSLRTVDHVELVSATRESTSSMSSTLGKSDYRRPRYSGRRESRYSRRWVQDTTTYKWW